MPQMSGNAVLRGAPGLHVLATSREPLRVEGEHAQRLAGWKILPRQPR